MSGTNRFHLNQKSWSADLYWYNIFIIMYNIHLTLFWYWYVAFKHK